MLPHAPGLNHVRRSFRHSRRWLVLWYEAFRYLTFERGLQTHRCFHYGVQLSCERPIGDQKQLLRIVKRQRLCVEGLENLRVVPAAKAWKCGRLIAPDFLEKAFRRAIFDARAELLDVIVFGNKAERRRVLHGMGVDRLFGA